MQRLLLPLLIFILHTSLAWAGDDLEKLDREVDIASSPWQTPVPPFSDWSLLDTSRTAGEITLHLKHIQSALPLDLILTKRDDDQAHYSQTRLYNLLYREPQNQQIDPSALKALLEAWRSNLLEFEEPKTFLLGHQQLDRTARQQATQKRIDRRNKAIKAEQRRKQLGVEQFLGQGQRLKLSETELQVWMGLLLLSVLVFLYPPVNCLRVGNGSPIIPSGHFTSAMLALAFALGTTSTLQTYLHGVTTDTSSSFEQTTATLLNILPSIFLEFDQWFNDFSGMGWSLLLGALIYINLFFIQRIAYVLYAQRQIGLITALLYVLFRFLSADTTALLPTLIADCGIGLSLLGLTNATLSKRNRWQIFFAVTGSTLAIWQVPCLIGLLPLLWIYPLIISPDWKATLASPLSWTPPLLTALAAAPLFAWTSSTPADLLLPTLFLGGFSDFSLAGLTTMSPSWIFGILAIVGIVMSIGIWLQPTGVRLTSLALLLSLLFCLIFKIGFTGDLAKACKLEQLFLLPLLLLASMIFAAYLRLRGKTSEL